MRHILLQPKVSSEDLLATRIRLDSIADAIRSGNISFAEAAKRYSNAVTSRSGGVMPNPQTGNNRFTRSVFNELYPGISINAMTEGAISNATLMVDDENQQLFRIVRLDRKIEEHDANLTDDYDKIYTAALAEAKHNKVLAWSAKMIRDTYIRIDDEYKDCAFKLQWTK